MQKVIKNRHKLSFSKKDFQQIGRLGMTVNAVKEHLAMYRHGSNYLKLNRPCTVHDGIMSLTKAQKKNLISFYEEKSEKYKVIKFVPASGAASRMFTEWYSFIERGGLESSSFKKAFFSNLKKYPFYPLIAENKKALKYTKQKNIKGLLEYILKNRGLKFGSLPKALIPFHLYGKKEMRTAFEEHLGEGAQYIRTADNVCHLHFTISPEHKKHILEKIKKVKLRYESLTGMKYNISLSFQSQSSKILSVDENNEPLRDSSGKLVFRPGGHGALLQNLQNIDADFIFIKNIDNIVPETLLREVVSYKKILGGLAMNLQEEIFSVIHQLNDKNTSVAKIDQVMTFCERDLNIIFPQKFIKNSRKEKIQYLNSILNRPLRVCGMVRNEREPGGGPFWIEGDDGGHSLQIIEGVHVDKGKKDQLNIWSKAKYFNPVDMVCGIKNYQGKKFNLPDYVDNDAYLISRKNEKGRWIKALEMPGLWNGSMAFWNTVFVKLPLIVFNPVKTVNDLLRPEHRINR